MGISMTSFYSKLVRLKEILQLQMRTPGFMFLFQIGSIKSLVDKGDLAFYNKFLFQIGSIKSQRKRYTPKPT